MGVKCLMSQSALGTNFVSFQFNKNIDDFQQIQKSDFIYLFALFFLTLYLKRRRTTKKKLLMPIKYVNVYTYVYIYEYCALYAYVHVAHKWGELRYRRSELFGYIYTHDEKCREIQVTKKTQYIQRVKHNFRNFRWMVEFGVWFRALFISSE